MHNGIGKYNFYKKRPKFGCKVCEHNPMGICELCGKEVPMRFVIQNGTASWCPKKKGVEE